MFLEKREKFFLKGDTTVMLFLIRDIPFNLGKARMLTLNAA